MSATRILPYTLSRLLEAQRAQIIRDQGSADEHGAEAHADWQPHATVPCLFWWDRESARGPAKLYASPQREIAQQEGGMLLASGTDITESDRVQEITDPDGNVVVPGPFDIVAVFVHSDHVEIAWKSATEARLA
jgi:hypothetical protein